MRQSQRRLAVDVLIARRDVYDAELNYRIEPGEPYFHDLRERWSLHCALPMPASPARRIKISIGPSDRPRRPMMKPDCLVSLSS
jgi:predicted proteasome-type protease